MTNDYPTIMAVTILYSAMLVFVILVVDILYGIVDPRIRVSEGAVANGRENNQSSSCH